MLRSPVSLTRCIRVALTSSHTQATLEKGGRAACSTVAALTQITPPFLPRAAAAPYPVRAFRQRSTFRATSTFHSQSSAVRGPMIWKQSSLQAATHTVDHRIYTGCGMWRRGSAQLSQSLWKGAGRGPIARER